MTTTRRPSKAITPTMVAQTVVRMEQGDSLQSIAHDLGVSDTGLRQWLKKLGYPTATRTVAMTREQVEAELAKIRSNGKGPSVPQVPQPPADRTWPTRGRFAHVLTLNTQTARERMALGDRLAKIAGVSIQQATQALTALQAGQTPRLSTVAARNVCQAMGVDPGTIWPEWDES